MAMAQDDVLVAAERRTYRAFYEDGLDDIFGGCVGLSFALGLAAPPGYRVVAWPAAIALVVLLVRAQPRVRRRLTEGRTGYVLAPKRDPVLSQKRVFWGSFIGIAALGALFSVVERAGGVSMPETGSLYPFFFLTATFLVRAYRTGLARYYTLAAIPVIAALLPWRIEAGALSGVAVPLIASSAASCAIGAVAVSNYLRRHPASVPR